RVLIWAGHYARALELLREVELMRFSFTSMTDTAMEVSQGWQQVALFGLASTYGTQSASNWLAYYTASGSLTYFATTTILNVFEGKLADEQQGRLETYKKKQMEQRQKVP